MSILRKFIDTPFGQIHARFRAGQGTPLVMLHAAPGSARMLAPLQGRIDTPTWALDLPGMGDSDPLRDASVEPDVAAFATPIAAAINALKLVEYDVYGTLAGTRVAMWLAAHAAAPPRRVILDGIGFPEPALLPELLEDYAPEIKPQIDGTHLLATFQLCRDQYLFYPWYARDAAHRRPTGLPSAEALHTKTLEALKSARAFRPLIRAAFRYDCAAALAAIKQPLLVSADTAAILPTAPALKEPPAEPLTASIENLSARADQINSFLA